jgi:hypothetical protein
MQLHPLDVVVMLPAFGDTVAQIFDVLLAQGLEVYPHDGLWFWRWRAYHMGSSTGVETMGDAFAAALTFRLQLPAMTSSTPSN